MAVGGEFTAIPLATDQCVQWSFPASLIVKHASGHRYGSSRYFVLLPRIPVS